MSAPDKHDETAYLLSSNANRERLLRSMERLKKGEEKEHDLLPLDEVNRIIKETKKPVLDRLGNIEDDEEPLKPLDDDFRKRDEAVKKLHEEQDRSALPKLLRKAHLAQECAPSMADLCYVVQNDDRQTVFLHMSEAELTAWLHALTEAPLTALVKHFKREPRLRPEELREELTASKLHLVVLNAQDAVMIADHFPSQFH